MVFFPLLFLTPNFVPRNQPACPMEIAPTLNPVTYVMKPTAHSYSKVSSGVSLAEAFSS